MKKLILGFLVLGVMVVSSTLNAGEYVVSLKGNASVMIPHDEGEFGYEYWHYGNYWPQTLVVSGDLSMKIFTDDNDNVLGVNFITSADDGSVPVIYLTDDGSKDFTTVGEPANLHTIEFDPSIFYNFEDDPSQVAKGTLKGGGNLSVGFWQNHAGVPLEDLKPEDVYEFSSFKPRFDTDNLSDIPMSVIVSGETGEIIYTDAAIYLEYFNVNGLGISLELAGGSLLDNSPVPEPASIAMMVTGLLGIGFYGYRRRNRKVAEK